MSTVTAQPLAPGTLLKGRYEIIRLIKGGGMSWIYQVREHRRDATTRIWALKELRMDADDNHTLEEARHLFEQEAYILVHLSHRNLPRVAAYFAEGERSYLVMEFIHGETLHERLTAANAPMLESQVLPWAIQVCEVLDYLHTQQPAVIFRDLKPGNVMVTPANQVKLIDFGIARVFKVGKDRDTITMGSENYAAPEQWGQGQTDPRSDIYGLGATLYHLLTNQAPLPAYVPGERLPIRHHNPSVSERLSAIVEQAMARERDQRFRSAAEMREALLRCLPPWERLRLMARSQEPVTAQPAVSSKAPPTGSPSPRCAACGATNRISARFCRRCGQPLDQTHPDASLVLVEPAGVQARLTLSKSPILIGRRSGSQTVDLDLSAHDPHGYVSRRHARITRDQGHYWITDLHSSNGTFVNERQLEPDRPTQLSSGDRLRMGKVVFYFSIPDIHRITGRA